VIFIGEDKTQMQFYALRACPGAVTIESDILCISQGTVVVLQCFDAVGWAAGRASGL